MDLRKIWLKSLSSKIILNLKGVSGKRKKHYSPSWSPTAALLTVTGSWLFTTSWSFLDTQDCWMVAAGAKLSWILSGLIFFIWICWSVLDHTWLNYTCINNTVQSFWRKYYIIEKKIFTKVLLTYFLLFSLNLSREVQCVSYANTKFRHLWGMHNADHTWKHLPVGYS